MLKKTLVLAILVCGILVWFILKDEPVHVTAKKFQDSAPSQKSASEVNAPASPQSAANVINPALSADDNVTSGEVTLEGQAVAKLSETLSTSEPVKHPEIFRQALADGEISRLNVLYAAAQYNSEELLGFWSDILNRKLPIQADEPSALRMNEPNILALGARTEIMMALDQIRLLASESENARHTLISTIKENGSEQYELARRESAYHALKEVDPRRSLQILKEMDPKDPLNAYLMNTK